MEEPLFVRQPDVPLQWHEAVAVIRSVTDALEDGRIRSVPPPGELALESDGSLHVSPRAAATAGAEPSPALRELLRELLPADAPSELRALTEDGTGSTPVTTLADFRRALAFFERPSLERDRRALVARLARIAEERQLESEIERLSRKARTEEQHPARPRRPAPATPTRNSFRRVLQALAALGVVAAVAISYRSVSTGSVWPVATAGQSGGVGKAIIGKLREAAQSAFGTGSPPQTIRASAERPAPAIGRRKPARQLNSASITPSPVPPPQPSFVPLDSRRLELAMLPTLVPSWSPPELLLSQYSTIIHDRSDVEVIPPVLLRPHLPTVGSIGESTDQLGTVDVVVAEDGRVEQVRLVRTNAERRFYDAMILAAVKSWMFRPASKSGHPVRYRVQITLS